MALGLLDAGENGRRSRQSVDRLRLGRARRRQLVVGDFGDADLVAGLIDEHEVDAIAHFAAKIVVPESVIDPLGYYLNNTAKARNLIECAVQEAACKHFIFSSTAAVYGETLVRAGLRRRAAQADLALRALEADGRMDARRRARAHDLRHVALRYFNVAGADPQGRLGQSTPNATHLIKRAVQTALGRHAALDVFGEDYPPPTAPACATISRSPT